MVQSMKVNINSIKRMERGRFTILMVRCIMVSGYMIKSMESELIFTVMGMNSKEIGKQI